MNIKVFLNNGSVIVVKADVFYIDDSPWIIFECTNGNIVAAIRQSEVIAIVKEATNENCEVPFK